MYLAANAEGFERIQTQPAIVPCFPKAFHEFGIQRSLNGRESHQDDMLLLGRKLVSQDIVAPSGTHKKQQEQ